MKQIIKKKENKFDAVEAFKGVAICTSCSSCSCTRSVSANVSNTALQSTQYKQLVR